MPRIEDKAKEQKKERLWLHIQRFPTGSTEADLATQMGMSEQRRTINSYLRELEEEGKIYKDGRLWFSFNEAQTRLRSIEISPEEATTLYLATRLLAKQQDKKNEPAESALLKLAHVLTSATRVGKEIAQAAAELANRPEKEGHQSIFRTMVQGYIHGKKVKITYQPYQGPSFETVFSTYLIEPSAVGYATYLVGYSSLVAGQRSYKLERIIKAELTREEYFIPSDFPGLAILKDAWSIILGQELITVTLRFSPQVRNRVSETIWHHSQQITEDDNRPGYIRWQVQVADSTDMLPWIRGWGGDVEVLEPADVRQKLADETNRLIALYQPQPKNHMLPYHLLYAKTDKTKEKIHLLLYHLIDVGFVAQEMWRTVLSAGQRQHLAHFLGLDEEAAGRLTSFLIALHDLGKASPAYQNKYAPPALKRELDAAGLVFDPSFSEFTKKVPHGLVSAWALADLLPPLLGCTKSFARDVASAIGGHHGSWPAPNDLRKINEGRFEQWSQARQDLFWELRGVFLPPLSLKPQGDQIALNSFLTILSGLTSVADWLGSIETAYPYVSELMSTRQYAQRSQKIAQETLHKLGWQGWQATGQTRLFTEMFAYAHITTPNELQNQVLAVATHQTEPTLLILEAPMGIGKTETALYLANQWLQTMSGRGVYMAMPTQATSNQMFGRFLNFLAAQYPHDLVNLHLVHGQADWQEQQQTLYVDEIELQTIENDQELADEQTGRVATMTWFKPRKRTLLAPFGVGTVDQTLLSILQTRHFFVRLFGLSHKIVIFDEVHAYDAFMSVLFERLLGWLRAIGTSVILLSATLTDDSRRKFAKAYTGRDVPPADLAYPRLTLAPAGGQLTTTPLPKPPSSTLYINWLTAEQLNAQVQTILQTSGGCIAIICNTVQRAQTVYRQLKELDVVEPQHLHLFHARIPAVWRQEVETQVLQKFGKDQTNRPVNAIVVATQVIEQSLDLNFDWLISDLAPVDLLLQRAGRLHRHPRPGRTYPPTLAIVKPDSYEKAIYEPYLLAQTAQTLQTYPQLTLPDDIPTLVEAVYNSPTDPALQKQYDKLANQRRDTQQKAKTYLIKQPYAEDLMMDTNAQLEEDNPTIHQVFQAQTRDIDQTLTLICLHQFPGGISLDPDQFEKIELNCSPSSAHIRALLQHSVSINNYPLIQALLATELPAPWRNTAALRYTRFLVFENGSAQVAVANGSYRLHLSREYGLEIEKEA